MPKITRPHIEQVIKGDSDTNIKDDVTTYLYGHLYMSDGM